MSSKKMIATLTAALMAGCGFIATPAAHASGNPMESITNQIAGAAQSPDLVRKQGVEYTNVDVWSYTMREGGRLDIRGHNFMRSGGALFNAYAIDGRYMSASGPVGTPRVSFTKGGPGGEWNLSGRIDKAGCYEFWIQRADRDEHNRRATVLVRIVVT